MLSLLADENFNGDIVRGVRLRDPSLRIQRIQDTEIAGATDPALLAWAASANLIVLSHDRNTLPGFAYARIKGGDFVAGLFILGDRYPIGLAIEAMILLNTCSEQHEWANRVTYLPL